MEIKIYCNYGVLGAEKRKKYTFGGIAVVILAIILDRITQGLGKQKKAINQQMI